MNYDVSARLAPILIADDSDDDVFMLRSCLKLARVFNPVFSVSNGEQVIACLNGEGIYSNRAEYPYPALLLLDLKMPRKDGFDVLEWIKANPEHRSLPVIVLSALGAVHQISRCFQLGARRFLLKPVDFQRLRHSMGCMRDFRLVSREDGYSFEPVKPGSASEMPDHKSPGSVDETIYS